MSGGLPFWLIVPALAAFRDLCAALGPGGNLELLGASTAAPCVPAATVDALRASNGEYNHELKHAWACYEEAARGGTDDELDEAWETSTRSSASRRRACRTLRPSSSRSHATWASTSRTTTSPRSATSLSTYDFPTFAQRISEWRTASKIDEDFGSADPF